MADDFVQVAPDSTGKKIDNTTESTGAGTVERQRVSLAAVGSNNQLAIDGAGKIGVNNLPATQPVTVVDGGSVVEGLTTDAAVVTDVNGTLSGKFRGLIKIFADVWDSVGHRLKVDGSSVTQPVSGTFWQATQPVSGTVTSNQGTANATPWNENLSQVGGTAVVTSLGGAPGVGGDTADGAADAGKSLKIGGKVVLNSAALPAALAASQRAPAMVDEYGRYRIVQNRPKLLGVYYFHSGRLTVLAAAHAATAGFFWIINPVASGVVVYVKKLRAQVQPTAATAFVSAPRVTVERVTFTGTASGATITTAKRDSNDATQVSSIRTASTGLTLTGGAVVAAWLVPAIMTAVGGIAATEQLTVDQHDDDDLVVLRAGEGIVVRQADAGTASDTRLLTVDVEVEER